MRAKFIAKHIPISGIQIVEIGALDNPTFPPGHSFDVRFIDYATKTQLVADHPNDPRFDSGRLVDVDYPYTGDYAKHIDNRFDLAIANHVIEHVPDTIGWLVDVAGILKPRGHLFLAVPDRRFTFDHLRKESDIADVLRAHYTGKRKPDRADIFSHFYYFRQINHLDFSDPVVAAEKLSTPRDTIVQAAKKAESFSKRPYVNVHCHVYTFDSFMKLHEELRALGGSPFEIVASRGTIGDEFFVLMRKV